MKTVSLISATLILLLSLTAIGGDKEDLVGTLSGEAAYQIGEAYQLSGLSSVVASKAGERLNKVLQSRLQDISADVFTSAAQRLLKSGRCKVSETKINVNQLNNEIANSLLLREEIKNDLKSKLKGWLPEVSKKILYEDIFQGEIVSGSGLHEVAEMEEKIVSSLDTTLNEKLDEIGNIWYAQTIQDVNQLLNPCDSGLCRKLNITVDVADLKKTFNSAFKLKNLDTIINIPLSQAFGESTVEGIHSRIEMALNGELPPEALHYLKLGPEKFAEYADKIKSNLPGYQLDKLKDKLLGTPLITLPNGAYGGILTGVAAAHYAKGIAGCPLSCNWYEINRGREVTKVLVWQLKNKEGVTLTIGNFLDFAKEIASKYGLGKIGTFAKINADFSKFANKIKKIEELADKIDQMTSSSLDKIQETIGGVVGQMEEELLKLQSELVKPIADAKSALAEGFQGVQDGFAGALGDFNGLPTKIDFPDNIFGKLGDVNPISEVKEAFNKSGIKSGIKDILSELNEKISDGIATLGSDAVYELGFLGPKAEIKEEEDIPFQKTEPKDGDDNIFDPVFLHSGEFYLKNIDLFIPGVGIPFEFVRIYRSKSDFPGSVGYNWTHNYAEKLLAWKDSPDGPGITWVDPLGRKYFFKKIGDKYVSPKGVFHKLSIVDGEENFLMISPEGDKTIFDRYGFLKSKSDPFGNEIRFIYDQGFRLITVIDTIGRRINFYYNGIGQITKVQDFAGRELKYSYDDLGNLTKAASPEGRQIHYRYSSNNHNLILIMDPKGDVYLKNRYGDTGPNKDKVVEQIYGDGLNKITAEYRDISNGKEMESRTWVTDGRGIVHVFDYNGSGNLLSVWIVNPSGGVEWVLSHYYDDNGLQIKTTYSDGRTVFRDYEDGNVVLWKVCNETCREAKFEYEKNFNKIISFADFSGSKRIYEYGANGELIREVNPDGSFAMREYSNRGQILSKTNEVGIIERYDYYDDGRTKGYLRSVVQDVTGIAAKTTYEYDIAGNLTRIIDPSGHKKEFLLNLDNQLLKDDRARYYYNDNGKLIRIVVGNNESEYLFEYDILDRLIAKKERVSENNFIETNYRRDPSGNVVGLIYPEGNGIFYRYDYKNRPFKIIKGDAEDNEEISINYGIDDNITGIVNKKGEILKYEYNGFGELAAVTNPLNTKKIYNRDQSGQIVAVRYLDDKGNLLSEEAFERDLNGRLKDIRKKLWREDPADSEWIEYQIIRDLLGRITEEIDPSGGATRYFYNGLGFVAKAVDPADRSTIYHYNGEGFLVKEERSIGKNNFSNITYNYDDSDRLSEIIDQEGNKTVFEHDVNDNLIKKMDARGFLSKYKYDNIGRRTDYLQEISDGLFAETHYEWDRNSRLISIVDSNENKTRYEYDSMNRLTNEKFADGGSVSYSYDEAGRLMEVRDQNGVVIKYSFTPLGQLQGKEIVGDSILGTAVQKFSYDSLGRLIYSLDGNNPKVKDDDVEVWYSYDSLSRRIGENQNGRWFAYNYDKSGNEKAIMYPSGYSVYMNYDKANRLKSIYNSNLSIEFKYGWLDRPTEVNFADRLGLSQYYDKLGRLVEKKFNYISKMIAGWSYSYDEVGNLILESDINEKTKKQYNYDGLDRIPPEGTSLDKLGNMVIADTSLDVANRYLTLKGEKLRYDKNGNLIGDNRLNYFYDGLNRLIKITDKDQNQIAAYIYDAHNRRVAKKTGKTEKYFYDGWNLAEEYNDSTYKGYIYDGTIDGLLMSVSKEGKKYFVTDRTGSVRTVLDDGGQPNASYKYDLYGQFVDNKGSVNQRFGYLGREHDEESELLYLRNRYYSPRIQRFLTPDPLGYKNSFYSSSTIIEPITFSYHDGLLGGFNSGVSFDGDDPGYLTIPNRYNVQDLNLYQFVLSNPLKYFDPMGLWSLYIDLNPDRFIEGRWTLVSDFGSRMGEGSALGRGQHRDWQIRRGDTPTGIYRYNGQRGLKQSGAACQVSQCGAAARIVMTPIAGNALLAANIPQSDGGRGRNGFLIHEGRVKEYLSTGKLQSTMGCVRLSHDDMLNLNSMVDSLATQGDIDGKIFVDEFTEPPVRGVEVVSGAYVEPLSH